MFTNVSRPSAVDVLRPFVVGDTFYADTTSTLAKRAIGSTNDVLIVSGGVPVWSSTVVLTSLSVIDSGFSIIGSADATKKLMFEVDAQTANDTLTISTGAQTDSRTLSVPVLTGNATLMVLSETQTVTGAKTFTQTVTVSIAGNSAVPSGGFTLTDPDNTNKRLVGGVNNGADQYFLQAAEAGVDYKTLSLNPNGGTVAVGAALTVGSTAVTSGAFSGGITIAKQARLAQVAGTTVDGDTWHDSTQKALQTYVNGIEQTLSGCIFTQTATRTIANTVTETSLFTTGVGTLTLPANFFLAGKTIRLVLTGTLADTGTPTVRLRLKYGSTTVIDSTAQTLAALTGTEEWRATCELTCRAAGASGTIAGDIWFAYDTATGTGAIQGLNIAPTTATVDTTASGAIDLTWEWGAADPANTVSTIIASAEVIN